MKQNAAFAVLNRIPVSADVMRLQEEILMIDLRNTCILVKTKEGNEMILKEAEKIGGDEK